MRSRLAEAIRLLAKENLIELFGHASCRSSDGNDIFILGHIHDGTKLPKDVTEEDIIVIDTDGKKIEGKYDTPEETPIHTEIYRMRPWVKGVVHAHSRKCLALSIVGKTILPVWNKGRFFAPKVPLWRYSEHIDTLEKGRRMVQEMGNSCALSLQGHGFVTCGTSIEEATILSLLAEETAALQIMVSTMGEIEMIEKFSNYNVEPEKGVLKPSIVKGWWQYYMGK